MEKKHNFLSAYLCGTKLYDVKTFYDMYDELKKSKERVPLYLYTINLIDKFRFNTWDKKIIDGNLIIKNETKNITVKFKLDAYLSNINPLLLGITSDEYNVEYSEDRKNVNVYFSEELASVLKQKKCENHSILAGIDDDFSDLLTEKLFKSYVKVGDLLLAIMEQLNGSQGSASDFNKRNLIADILNFLKIDDLKELSIDDLSFNANDLNDFKTCFDNILEREIEDYQSRGGNPYEYEEIINYLEKNFIEKLVGTLVQEEYIKGIYREILNIYSGCNFQENDINEILIESLVGYFEHTFDKSGIMKIYYQNHIADINSKKIEETFFIPDGDKIKIASLQVWEIIGDKSFKSYLETENIKAISIQNLYIGQAFGTNGNRTVLERIGAGHEKLQRAQSYCPDDKEIALLFFYMNPKSIFLKTPGDEDLGSQFSEFLNLDKNIPNSELVNICEIGLINFFKPQLNKDFVNGDFTEEDLRKYSSVKNIMQNYEGIILEVDCAQYSLAIETASRKGDSAFTSDKRFIKGYLSDSNIQIKGELFSHFNEYD